MPEDPNAMAAESAVRQIGKEFGRLRTVRGERIEDIAAYLDIKSTYLFAIEQGDLSLISSKREAKSIVREYAGYLGLDGDRIVAPMDPIIASLHKKKAPTEPTKTAWVDRTSVLILMGSVVLGVLAGWSWIGTSSEFAMIAPPLTAEVAGEGENDRVDVAAAGDGEFDADINPQDLTGEAAEANALLTELQSGQDGEPSGAGAPSADDAAGADGVPGKEDPANVLAASVAERGDGAHIYEAENTDARVIVRALNDVSVQVTSQTRDYVWTRKMKTREMLLVPNRDDLRLWTADAASIEILLDGAVLPPLGPEGQVISALSLRPSSLSELSETLSEDSEQSTF